MYAAQNGQAVSFWTCFCNTLQTSNSRLTDFYLLHLFLISFLQRLNRFQEPCRIDESIGIVPVSRLVFVMQIELTGVRREPDVDRSVLLCAECGGNASAMFGNPGMPVSFTPGLIDPMFAMTTR